MFLKNFMKSDDGATTVEYVVLTAAVVGLALAVFTSLGSGVSTATSNIAGKLDTATK